MENDSLPLRLFRWAFYGAFFLFNTLIFGFTTYLFGKYPNLLSGYQTVHYLSALGIVLFFVGLGFELVRHRNYKKNLSKLDNENIHLKARIKEFEDKEEKVLTGAKDPSDI